MADRKAYASRLHATSERDPLGMCPACAFFPAQSARESSASGKDSCVSNMQKQKVYEDWPTIA